MLIKLPNNIQCYLKNNLYSKDVSVNIIALKSVTEPGFSFESHADHINICSDEATTTTFAMNNNGLIYLYSKEYNSMMIEFKFTSMPFVENHIFVYYVHSIKGIVGFDKLWDIVARQDFQEITGNCLSHNMINVENSDLAVPEYRIPYH